MSLLDPHPLADESAMPGRSTAWSRTPRLIGVGLVVLLHLGVAALILSSLPTPIARLPAAHEVFFLFPPPATARLPRRIEPPIVAHAAAEPFSPQAPAALSAVPRTTDGLGLALFGCAPETRANLTPEERAHCDDAALATAADRETMPDSLREQAREAQRWQDAIALREASLPCVRLDRMAAPTGRDDSAAIADPLCLLRRIEQGGGK